jgi:hypothetical protein
MVAIVLPDTPNCFKIIMKGTTQGTPFINTWYMQHAGGTMDQLTMDALATACANAYWTSWATAFGTADGHVLTTAVNLQSRTSGFGTSSVAHAGSTTPTARLPVGVAVCISEIIQDRYRGGHPRFYLPALQNSWIVNGKNWETTALGGLQSSANAFRTALNAINSGSTQWTLVAVRYFIHGQLQSQGQVRPVTGMKVRTRVDSMRRRYGSEIA